MKILKKIFYLLILLTISGFMLPSDVTKPDKHNDKKDPIYLFIQSAEFGEIHYNSNDKTYSLILHNTDPWIIYFSNIPDRITSFTTTDKFITQFKKDLAQNNHKGLNAGLIGLEDGAKKMVRYTFTLTEPKYDETSNQTYYTAHVIPGPQVTPLPHSSKYRHVALFIDGCADCGGSGF